MNQINKNMNKLYTLILLAIMSGVYISSYGQGSPCLINPAHSHCSQQHQQRLQEVNERIDALQDAMMQDRTVNAAVIDEDPSEAFDKLCELIRTGMLRLDPNTALIAETFCDKISLVQDEIAQLQTCQDACNDLTEGWTFLDGSNMIVRAAGSGSFTIDPGDSFINYKVINKTVFLNVTLRGTIGLVPALEIDIPQQLTAILSGTDVGYDIRDGVILVQTIPNSNFIRILPANQTGFTTGSLITNFKTVFEIE